MLPSSERLRHPDDWVGEELCGKWRIDELIGVGGMAAVYAATARDGTRVAIKLLHAYFADDDDMRRRFLREGYAANRVKHPAVVSAHADGVAPGDLAFLVLELLEGAPLDELVDDEGRLPTDRVLRIADQVLDALAAAHDEGVLHRDLKPENLIVDGDDVVRLVDFGIAYLDDQGPGPRMTVQGYAMGTPGFMAPEQARGDWDEVDGTTDLWSLGATMFALITGHDVFMGSPNQVLVASMTKEAPPIHDLAPDLPAEVAAIIDRSLAFEQGDRWPNARAMQRAVRHALGLRAANVSTLAPVTAAERPRTSTSWQPLLVAGVGALTIALAGATEYQHASTSGRGRLAPAAAPAPMLEASALPSSDVCEPGDEVPDCPRDEEH
jgi:serine/threonine-protein kinase